MCTVGPSLKFFIHYLNIAQKSPHYTERYAPIIQQIYYFKCIIRDLSIHLIDSSTEVIVLLDYLDDM